MSLPVPIQAKFGDSKSSMATPKLGLMRPHAVIPIGQVAWQGHGRAQAVVVEAVGGGRGRGGLPYFGAEKH